VFIQPGAFSFEANRARLGSTGSFGFLRRTLPISLSIRNGLPDYQIAMSTQNLSHGDVIKMLSTVNSMMENTSELYNQYGNDPASKSMAGIEQISFANPELVKDVCSRGMQSMEAAADHIMVFLDALQPPAKTIGPLTCIRGSMESAAIACWFLDPSIDVRTRVGRCFAFRYAGFDQQAKFFRAGLSQKDIDRVQQRINQVEQEATSLGYQQILDKNGKTLGIGTRMPTITELIARTLDRESDYRLLSAVAHGHHWATVQVGFDVIEVTAKDGTAIKAIEKSVNPAFILYAAHLGVTSFSKVLWYMWQFFGWEQQEIQELLDSTYQQLGYNPKLRFWR
jgi:hypothetical protein